jgi:hypothetical protein
MEIGKLGNWKIENGKCETENGKCEIKNKEIGLSGDVKLK